MAKKKEQIVEPPVGFGDYLTCNHEKLDRVINGTIGKDGRLFGGLGKNASPEAVLAEYDKLGGGIKKDGRKVAMGSFYDFDNKCPQEDVKYDDLEYEEEYVLMRKPIESKGAKRATTKERVAKVAKAKKLAAGKLAGATKAVKLLNNATV